MLWLLFNADLEGPPLHRAPPVAPPFGNTVPQLNNFPVPRIGLCLMELPPKPEKKCPDYVFIAMIIVSLGGFLYVLIHQ
jgi:hypothetical protein